jgi:hypothetical protein
MLAVARSVVFVDGWIELIEQSRSAIDKIKEITLREASEHATAVFYFDREDFKSVPAVTQQY